MAQGHMLRNALVALGLLALAGCGETLGEQIVVGAAAGGATAYALDFDALGGAAVGAAANIAYCRQYPSRC